MTPDDYVVGHVRDALAHEGETDVQAAVVAGRLVLTSNVATEERRLAVSAIASRASDGLDVVNELTVVTASAPAPREELT